MDRDQTDTTGRNGPTVMPHAAQEHMRAVFEQMDLLLASGHVEMGLAHLVAMLQHLQAFRHVMA